MPNEDTLFRFAVILLSIVLIAGSAIKTITFISHLKAEILLLKSDRQKLRQGFNDCISKKKEIVVSLDNQLWIFSCTAWKVQQVTKI